LKTRPDDDARRGTVDLAETAEAASPLRAGHPAIENANFVIVHVVVTSTSS
jgi:hypothetical protein